MNLKISSKIVNLVSIKSYYFVLHLFLYIIHFLFLSKYYILGNILVFYNIWLRLHSFRLTILKFRILLVGLRDNTCKIFVIRIQGTTFQLFIDKTINSLSGIVSHHCFYRFISLKCMHSAAYNSGLQIVCFRPRHQMYWCVFNLKGWR